MFHWQPHISHACTTDHKTVSGRHNAIKGFRLGPHLKTKTRVKKNPQSQGTFLFYFEKRQSQGTLKEFIIQ